MTVTASGSFAVDAVAGVQGAPSISKAGRFTVNFAGVTSPSNLTIVIGETASSTPPATFGALSNATDYSLDDGSWTTSTFRKQGGTYAGTAVLASTPAADSAWTPGNYAWICLFDTPTLISGTVPVAVIAGGVIVA